MARRLLVIWLTRFASDLWLRGRLSAGPFALIARKGNSDHIHCLNEAALGLGLRVGMPLADARAIWPDLHTESYSAGRALQGLRLLARWASRYAPRVAMERPDGLVADITGVAHLFGGEAALREDLQARLERAGFQVQSAIAPTRAAAWALSRHGGGIVTEGSERRLLGPLPVSALRLEPEITEGLTGLGFTQIGDLFALPRAPLTRRFGPVVVQRLDQLLGSLPEPLAPEPEPPHFALRLTLPEPIGRSADVMEGLRRLLEPLCARLQAAGMGARRLRLDLQRVDHILVPIEIGLARPMRDPARIAALFSHHIEAADAGFGIEVLRLEATLAEPLAPAQISAQAQQGFSEDLADLISTLGNRLGFERILRSHPRDRLLPERQFTWLPATSGPTPASGAAAQAPGGPQRPLTLFAPEWLPEVSGHPPARFRWRGGTFTTLRASGPERILPDWWVPDPAWGRGLRDYWRLETHEGARLWLFHTPQSAAWAVQGEFL